MTQTRTFNEMLAEYNEVKNKLRFNKQRQDELLGLNGFRKTQDISVGDPNRVSKPTETLGMAICQLVEKENKLTARLMAIREEIDKYLVLQLSTIQRLCVQGKLLNGYSFTELAKDIHYSKGQTKRIYNEAMAILDGERNA